MSIAKPAFEDFIHGISVTIENRSVVKAFIKSVQVELPSTKQVIPFLYEGFTGFPLPKITIEPGQAFSFNIIQKNLNGASTDPKSYGNLVIITDLGYKFATPAKVFQEHLASLFRVEA